MQCPLGEILPCKASTCKASDCQGFPWQQQQQQQQWKGASGSPSPGFPMSSPGRGTAWEEQANTPMPVIVQ
eukprot:991957-Pelagomonas_calceolata.AAC.1